ncbi:MAG: formate dehydrogenase subunit delta [Acidimicrobiia bacterium]|nr:formate dehydrogenase subunit delta [Acidimicrobiia bacterium]
MDVQRLVKMANDIASFFEAEPDTSKGARGAADHLKNFWDPRMRRQLLSYLDEQGGAGLKSIVLEALRQHRLEIAGQQPPDR